MILPTPPNIDPSLIQAAVESVGTFITSAKEILSTIAYGKKKIEEGKATYLSVPEEEKIEFLFKQEGLKLDVYFKYHTNNNDITETKRVLKEIQVLSDSFLFIKAKNERGYNILSKENDYAKELIGKLKLAKRDHIDEDVEISTFNPPFNYVDYEESEKKVPRVFQKFINSDLDSPRYYYYMSLIALASRMDALYAIGKSVDADRIRAQVKVSHDRAGLKFCNLYERGYIKNYLQSLGDYDKATIVDQLDKFVLDCKSIFFVSNLITIGSLTSIAYDAHDALHDGEDYVAIHSLGNARHYVGDIIEQIREVPEEYKSFPINDVSKGDGVREKSMIWYKNQKGEWLLKLAGHTPQ
jgi:hypothetical protein